MLKHRFIIYGSFACLVIIVSYQLLSAGSEKPAEVNIVMKDAIRQLERFNAFDRPQLNKWNGRDPFELSSTKAERPDPPASRARLLEQKAISADQAVSQKTVGKDYQLIAILSLAGEWSAYVRAGDQGYSVKQGDLVEGEFEVLSVGPTGVVIKKDGNNQVMTIELSKESNE